MDYNIISADSHIDMTWMPGNLWLDQAPPDLKDSVPRVVDTTDGPRWFAEGNELGVFGGVGFGFNLAPKRGMSTRVDRMHDAGFYQGGPHPTTPELRLKDMQLDGIDAEVVYGILAVGFLFKNPQLTQFVYETYNSWVAGFSNSNPGRWAPLACVPNHSPQAAADELRRAASLGLKGADFAVKAASTPNWYREWDVLWAAADECNMPISFHTTGYPGWSITKEALEAIPADYMPAYTKSYNTVFQIAGAEFLATTIWSGICERFPNFKFVLGESGVGWVPFIINRMDEDLDEDYSKLELTMKPSDYWRRQGYTTFQHELNVAHMLPLLGEGNVLWGSDYPHGDGVWPDSQATLDNDLAGMTPQQRRMVTRDNAGHLYGFLS